MAATVTVAYVTDHEGDGTCYVCGREGLRWIVTLSDGSSAGVECVKKLLGWKPAVKSYSWVAGCTRTETAVNRHGQTIALWQKGRTFTVSVDGHPVLSGPQDFAAKAYAQRAND